MVQSKMENNMERSNNSSGSSSVVLMRTVLATCPSCGFRVQYEPRPQGGGGGGGGGGAAAVEELVGLPAGVKFDPTDQELLEHLESKARADPMRLHPLIDEFIPTIDQGEDGICYTHPENLPGVSEDGVVRHFFHRPSRAYTTGTRKRRKVVVQSTSPEAQGSETRWHKTGKTRPVFAAGGRLRGFKKILVLYTNYGKQRKPQKTNWIMHQYHLGVDEEEKDGELVVSKVFYQTQPRQCTAAVKEAVLNVSALEAKHKTVIDDVEDDEDDGGVDYYSQQQSLMAYNDIQGGQSQMLHGFPMHGGGGASSFLT